MTRRWRVILVPAAGRAPSLLLAGSPDKPDLIAEGVRRAGEQAEAVIVLARRGHEYQSRTDPAQQALARSLLAARVAPAVGHHPRVVQEVEPLPRETPGKQPRFGVVT